MSRRNRMIWGTAGGLAVLAIILTAALFLKEKETEDTLTESQEEIVEQKEKRQKNKKLRKEEAEEGRADTGASLVVTGDVLLNGDVLENYKNQGVEGILDEEMLGAVRDADLTVINEEFPFSSRGTQAPDKQFTFRTDPAYVRAFREMGVDMVTLANNHVLDYGEEALTDTMNSLDEAGILYAGAGCDKERAAQVQIVEKRGIKIGMLAASRVIPVPSWNVQNREPGVFCTYDPALLLEAIGKAKKECDYLLVYVHWGIERSTEPEDYQKTMARQYIDAGADAVIGSHPHVLQGIEFYEGKPICYSLGNFIFNREIGQTMAVRLEVKTGETKKLQILPASAANAKTGLLKGQEAERIYRTLEGISTGIRIDADGVVSESK